MWSFEELQVLSSLFNLHVFPENSDFLKVSASKTSLQSSCSQLKEFTALVIMLALLACLAAWARLCRSSSRSPTGSNLLHLELIEAKTDAGEPATRHQSCAVKVQMRLQSWNGSARPDGETGGAGFE